VTDEVIRTVLHAAACPGDRRGNTYCTACSQLHALVTDEVIRTVLQLHALVTDEVIHAWSSTQLHALVTDEVICTVLLAATCPGD